jgi:AcrR family transcriptional regulator
LVADEVQGMERLSERQKKVIAETAKDHVFDAVIQVTQKRDATDFTMQQIANEAGMAIGSLYRYFKDKDELLTHVIERLVNMHAKRQEAIASGSGTVLERLERLAVLGFQFTSDHVLLFRIFERRGSFNHSQEKVREQHFAAEVQQIRDVMAEGIAQGVLRKIDPLLMAQLFFGSTISFFFLKTTFEEYSAEQFGQELIRFFKA